MGRLSNPSKAAKTLILQGSTSYRKGWDTEEGATDRLVDGAVDFSNEEEGRLSNPVQRRLSKAEIDDLIRYYGSGMSVNVIAHRFGIHRTTVMNHLESRGVQSRRSRRKLSTATVVLAASRYAGGLSLASTAKIFGVSGTTITRELRAAGYEIRPRRGWAVPNQRLCDGFLPHSPHGGLRQRRRPAQGAKAP